MSSRTNICTQHSPFGDEMKDDEVEEEEGKIPNDVEKLFNADLKSTYF